MTKECKIKKYNFRCVSIIQIFDTFKSLFTNTKKKEEVKPETDTRSVPTKVLKYRGTTIKSCIKCSSPYSQSHPHPFPK